MKRLFVIPLLLICAACIQLGGESQPMNYYLLEAFAEQNTGHSQQDISLIIESVELASHLDRPQIVSRVQTNALHIATDHRWADPLVDNLTRTLRENLYRQIPGISIATGPWSPERRQQYRLELVVNRFNGTFDQQAEVDIRWTLSTPGNNEQLTQKHFVRNQPAGESYLSLVSSLSVALNHFSQDVATELATAAQQ